MKQNKNRKTVNKGDTFEFKMSQQMAKAILSDDNGKVKKVAKGKEPQFLIDYVNDQMNFKGKCVKVIVG